MIKLPKDRRRNFFHCCLLDRECWQLEVKQLRVCVLIVDRWQHTFGLGEL